MDEKDKDVFEEYRASLINLQNAFILAGLSISFNFLIDPNYGKVVEVIKNKKRCQLLSIEADSPAQAIKDVAAGVKL